MQLKKFKVKQLCPHKLARISADARLAQNKSSRKHRKSCSNTEQDDRIRTLIEENQKLKAQNNTYQEYFATFDKRYKEQKKQNKKLKKRVEQLSKQRDEPLSERKSESTYILSDRTMGPKISRGHRESRKTLTSDYY